MAPPEPAGLGLGEQPEGYKSGFVSLVGRPNVGKSTLLNQILRSKVAITSERPQTTRNAIRGIWTTPRAQLVFVDTPGLHKPLTALGERLNTVVRATLGEVDVVVFLVDVAAGIGGGDEFIAAALRELSAPIVIAMNKVDLVGDSKLEAEARRAAELGDWPRFPVSARTGNGVRELLEAAIDLLPEGPLYYPSDTVTDQPVQQVVAELIREKVLELTRDEVPHSVAVVVEEMSRSGDLTTIDALIYVERNSQKAIVIGKGGALLKEIGSKARREIEALLGTRVFLDLRVKVERDWQRRAVALDRLGYGAGPPA